MPTIIYTIITPSTAARPRALFAAIASVAQAHQTLTATDAPDAHIEMLIGYDGVTGPRVAPDGAPAPDFVRFYDLPHDGDYGNAIRHALLRASRGTHVIFLDDDNALTPDALRIHYAARHADLHIAPIDTSRAFPNVPQLPVHDPAKPLVRPTNIDPLCICATRDLVVTRCGGWTSTGGYEADYVNILKYSRRAHSTIVSDAIVGIYDAGNGLDSTGVNWRQAAKEKKE